MKSFRASAFFLIAVFASIAAQAADFKVLLDLDNQPSTGCSVITGNGTFSGVEAVLTTTVDIVGGVQRVTGVSRQQCVNGTFAAPITVDNSGWAVGTDPSGKVVVETKVSFSELSESPIDSAHVAFVASSGGLADVILSRSDSSPILFPDHVGRRRSGPGTSRSITLDGDLSDWGMIAPLVDGNASTGSSNFRFTNIYGYAGNTHLYFAFELRNNRNAPTAVDDSFFVLIGQALNVAAPGILGNDISPNGAPLSAILVSGPQHGALTLNANGSFVYLHDGSNAPQDSFRYKASNGTVDSNTAQVRIDITTNTAPHALPDSGYTVAHRGTLTVPAKGVLINDSDADGDTLHAQLASNPSHGTVTLNADGSFTYTHDGSNTLTDSFTYRAADGSSTSNVATVTITISPDIPPVAVADGYALLEGATLNVPAPGLFANDTDVDTPQSFWTAVVVTPPAHGNLTMLPGGGFTYVNDSVTGASDSFTYRVNDGIANGNSVTVALTVTPVNDAPVFATNAPVTVLDTDGPQSIPFVTSSNGGASDELGQAINYLVTNDNNALFSVQPSIDAAGVLHFTPIVGMSGVATLTIRAHDNGGVANGGVDTSAPQTSAANVDKIPAITSANTTTFVVSQAGTFTVTTNGLPKPSIAEVGALPAGVTFVDGTGPNKGTGVLSGTPAANTGGSYPITFQATNPHGSSPIQNFTLIVNQPPAITSPAGATFTRNQAGTFSITTTGFPTPALTETGALPAGLSFVDNTNGTATLSGTPTAVGGIYSITVNANNGVGGTVQQTLSITINEAPAITSGNATNFQAGTPATFSVTTTGFPAPALGETGALPTGITFVDNGNGTATLGGTAANGSGGVYSITITATNVAGSAPQSFTITVCNNIVVTAPGVTSATAGSAFSQTFTQTGAVGGATFTTASTLPTGITLATNGTLSGTPTQTGSFPIVVTVTDGNGCTGTSATYTLVVGCQTISVTNPGVNSGVAGAAFSQTFTQTGAIGGATFTTASALPTGLSLSTGGVLSGAPTVTGTFPIVVTVTDGNGCTGNGASYTLTINCQTITVTNPGVNSGVAAAAFSQTFTQTGSIGGATFTTSSTLPAGLALSTGGVLSGTPTQVGSFPIVVTVTDGNGCTGNGAIYTLTITCQTITVTNPGVTTGTANAAFSQTFTQTGGIGTITWSVTGAPPSGITLNTSTGVLSGTPTQTGSFPIVVTATDANGCTGSGATYTLVINCQTITVTNPGVTTGTVSAAFSQTFTQT
ncbi:MAG: large repetitive protein, partial [Acidobacteriota bacterium]|nr:large repetitive protein [Acidobacteriota bacterium]